MSSKPALTEDEKLVVVPDSCTLAYWAAPIPKRYFTDAGWAAKDRPQHFYDLLKKLPRDKFKEIEILDVVAAEALGRDTNGDLIDPNHDKREKAMKASDMDGLVKMLFEEKDPFFKLVRTEEGQKLIEVHKQIHALNAAVDDYAASLGDEEKAAEIKKGYSKKIREARKAVSKDSGEMLVRRHLLDHKNPTFFISDEKGARSHVIEGSEKNQHGCIYVDHTVGFLEMLTGYGMDTKEEPSPGRNLLVQECGFKNAVRPKEMFLHMADYDNPNQVIAVSPSRLTAIAAQGHKASFEADPWQL